MTRFKRTPTTFQQWIYSFRPRPELDLDLRFIGRVFACTGGLYALLHIVWAWQQWNAPLRAPILLNLVNGIINGALIGLLFRFGKTNAAQSLGQRQFAAGSNLLLGLCGFAMLSVWIPQSAGWALDTVEAIAIQAIDFGITILVLNFSRRLARFLPQESNE
jgi:hypothetical protein